MNSESLENVDIIIKKFKTFFKVLENWKILS